MHCTLIPVIDYLAPPPLIPPTGSALVHVQSGTVEGGGQKLYLLSTQSTLAGAPLLTQYNTWTDSWFDCSSPGGVGAASAVRLGTAMCMCGARRQLYAILPAGTNDAPVAGLTLKRYDIDTDTWTALSSVFAPPLGVWSTYSAAILHRCRIDNPSNNDNDIFVICGDAGLAGLRMYRYDIAADTWSNCDGIGGARAGAPSNGASLNYIPSRNLDLLYSLRGGTTPLGGATVVDVYNVATDRWSTLTPPTGIDSYTFGPYCGSAFSTFYDPDFSGIVGYSAVPHYSWQQAGGYRPAFFSFHYPTSTSTVMHFDNEAGGPGVIRPDTTAQLACFVRPEDGYAWYYALRHGEQSFFRVLRSR